MRQLGHTAKLQYFGVEQSHNEDVIDVAQAVNRRPLVARVRFRSQDSPRAICDGQSGTPPFF